MSFLKQPISFRALFARKPTDKEPFSFGNDPGADWFALLCAFFLVAIVAVGMSIYVYAKIDKGEIFLVDKKETVPLKTLDRFQLEQTVSFFEDKNERFSTLERQPLSTTDPFVPGIKPKK